MKTKKTLILFGLLCTHLSALLACSCHRLYICEHIENPTTLVAFQARVVGHKKYSPENSAIYVEIIKRYKDEVGMTDTIKIYGRDITAGCAINVYEEYPIGDTMIMAIGPTWGSMQIINPDSLTENYWEYFPTSCTSVQLNIKNGIAKGLITTEILEYPLFLFDEHIGECQFSVNDLQAVKCAKDNFIVFPNPSSLGSVIVKGDYVWNTFEKIRIFGADGRLLSEFDGSNAEPSYRFEIDGLQNGLNIIEITCDDRKYYKKVMVEK